MNINRVAGFVSRLGLLPIWLWCCGVQGAVPPQCPNPRLSYFGGPVLANVQVVPVFYGTNVSSQVVASMPQFYADVTASSYWAWLCEYDTPTQHIGPGTSTAGYVLPVNPTPASTTDDALQNLLVQQVTLGNLPAPNSNTLYMVHFPANVSIAAFGGQSCVDFCAYHNSFASGQTVYVYAVLMDTFTGGCASGCGGNGTGLDNQTDTASHELVESVTDPYIGLDTSANYAYPCGWGDNNNSCGELADICDAGAPGDSITVGNRTWVVQEMWSDCQASCVSSGPLPVANDQNLITLEGASLPITLSMANGNSFCHYQLFTVTASPAHGTLSGSSSNLVYTPAPGFAGQDSFLFTANGSLGTVSISVVPFLITSATFDPAQGNFVVCWNSQPGVGYSVLTNTLLSAVATWTSAGVTNAIGTNTCFVLEGASAASASMFVAIKQN